MLFLINLIMCVMIMTAVAGPIGGSTNSILYNVNETLKPTRRILKGHAVSDTKPYMVYLRAAPTSALKIPGSDWLCGGVIIDESFILTSAACIEDAKHFFVVSGTNKWVPLAETDNECIKNGAKKAVWKCVPKSYVYDGDDFDNIRWMVGDIAVVKVEDPFNFEKRVRGCDFIPKKVDFNNRSIDLEKAHTLGTIAGWGSTESFGNLNQENVVSTLRASKNSPELMETDVQLVSIKNCKKRWDPRYHYIIDEQMVCTKDVIDDESMSELCSGRNVDCKELQYSDTDDDYEEDKPKPDKPIRRMIVKPGQLQVHNAGHFHDTRRKNKIPAGGFCENDHGGPLIVGQGRRSVVIGVMSACLTKDISGKCYGPFLFTSVYRYRTMITCAIDKDVMDTCRRLLKTSKTPMAETYFDWSTHKKSSLRAFSPAKEEEAPEKKETASKKKEDKQSEGYL